VEGTGGRVPNVLGRKNLIKKGKEAHANIISNKGKREE